jgi:LysR family glycine cleavage system transcriptional activator
LRVRSIPSFLAKWLTPRLPRFNSATRTSLRLVAEDSKQAVAPG